MREIKWQPHYEAALAGAGSRVSANDKFIQTKDFLTMTDASDQIKTCVELLEHSTLGVVAVNLKSKRISCANRTAEEVIGASPLEGLDVRDLVRDKKSEEALLSGLQLREHNEANEYTVEIYPLNTKGTKPIRISVAGVPVRDEQGAAIFSFAVLQNLTMDDKESAIRDIIESETDYITMMDKVKDELLEVFGFDIISLAQYSSPPEAKGTVPQHVRSLYQKCTIKNPPAELQSPAETYKVWYYLPYSPEMEQLALDREIRHIPDLSALLEQEAFSVFKEDPFVQGLLKGGYHSTIRVPVFEGKQLVAALTLFRHGKSAFGTEDEKLLRRLRLRAAVRAAYFSFQHAEDAFRMRFQQELAACNRTEEIADTIVKMQDRYGWRHISVFRVDHAQRRLRLLRQAPLLIPDDYDQDIGVGVMGHVLEHQPDQGIKIDDIDASEHGGVYISLPDRECPQSLKMISEMCVPVAWGGTVRWLVNVEDPRQCAFSDEEFVSLKELMSEVGQLVETMAERLRSAEVFELTHDALFIVDEDNHISRMNPAADSLLGKDAKDKKLEAFLPDNAKSGVILEGGSFHSTETTIRRTDGVETKVLISGSAPAADIPGRLFVAKDLRAYERTQELKALGQVFLEVAMQTQTPLSLAASGLHRLGTGDVEGEDPASLAERIQRELNKIQLTLEKMSLYHEGESDVPCEPIATDLWRLVERVRQGLPEADQKRVSITGVKDLYVLADPFRTEFVLRCLLAYLVDYRTGSRDVSIELARSDGLGTVNFSGYVLGNQHLLPGEQALVSRLRAYLALSEPVIRKFVKDQQKGSFMQRVSKDGQAFFTVGLPIVEEE